MSEYLKYFDLDVDPFDLPPDPSRIYESESLRESLAIVQHVIRNRKGFAAIYGEKGIGKTALIRHVEQTADAATRIIVLSEGNISFHSLLKEILRKVGLPMERQSKGSMQHELYQFLIRSLATGLNCVLMIDDAHELHADVLEDLRLLSNLETSRTKLIQILFVGEPKLEEVLAASTMRQLRQRIGIVHRMTPMTYNESIAYIHHRVGSCGAAAGSLFSGETISLIAANAAGLPGRISVLCHNALIEGYIRNERPVTGTVFNSIRNEESFQTLETLAVPGKRHRGLSRRLAGLWNRRGAKPALCALLAFLVSGWILYAVSLTGPEHFWRRTPAAEKTQPLPDPVLPAPMEAKNPDPPVPADPSGKELPGRAPYSRVGFETKKILTVPTDATLTSLAVKHYGSANPMLLDLILEMNPGITDLDVILQGQNVRLPIVTDTTAILKFPEGAYKIHIGTFMQQGKAAEYRRGLDFKGKTVEIEPRKVSGKKTWYRILAGPYPTQEECEEALARLNDTK